MPIHHRDPDTKQGPRDAQRHRDKQREAIRRGIRDIVADESIITRRRDEKVKVPIRGVKSFKFKHGSPKGGGGGAGAGSGEGQPGDVIGRKKGKGKPGQAGDQPGEDYIESEIEISELIKYMIEDMGLPDMRPKDVAELIIPQGWQFKNISRTGLRPNLEKKRTIKEGMNRLLHFLEYLKVKTGRSEEECETALEECYGDLNEALELLNDPGYAPAEYKEAAPILTQDDMRYRTMEEDYEHHSNAVILAMMDVSASMGSYKKFIARSFYFWLVEILRTMYENVDVRFISHTTQAKLVDEYHFFHKGESGGTFCYTAFDLASELVEKEYPVSKYNVYTFLFSDGDDWNPETTVRSIRRLLDLDVNMVGYGEIMERDSMSRLAHHVEQEFSMFKPAISGTDVRCFQSEIAKFMAVLLNEQTQILPAIKEFLQKERWQ